MDWDKRYQKLDTPWDKGAPAPAIEELIEREQLAKDRSVLVPGCGLGHDAKAWADAGFQATGLDISATALERAEALHGTSSTRWLNADLFDSKLPEQGNYDVIWEHTCFCAIPLDWRKKYVESVFHLLKPGGIFCGLFFTNTGKPPGEGPPFQVDREEVIQLFSPRFSLQWEKLPSKAYETRVGREWLMSWKKV